MTAPTITSLPEAPSRTSPGADFASKGSAWVAAMGTLTTEVNAVASWVEDQVTSIEASEAAAASSATAAATSASAASASATAAASVASAWVSEGSYTIGETFYSPVDFQTYRAKTTHSGLTDDPSSDTTNWVLQGTDPVQARLFSLWTGA